MIPVPAQESVLAFDLQLLPVCCLSHKSWKTVEEFIHFLHLFMWILLSNVANGLFMKSRLPGGLTCILKL